MEIGGGAKGTFCFQVACTLHHNAFPTRPVRSLIHTPYFRLTAALFVTLVVLLLAVERPVKMERRIAERAATLGKDAPTHWLIPVWLWRGLAVNTGLAALLVALTPLAARPLPPRNSSSAPTHALSRRDRWILAAASTLFLASTLPRLDHSLWGDEEYSMKTYIAAQPVQGEDGTWKMETRPWSTTFWDYTRPTNHVGYTVIARLFHEALFRPDPDPAPDAPWFSERAIRLPVLLAGLGALFSLVWCCRVWGFGAGAAWVALGYVGHAWLVRFGADARGYGFVLFLTPLLLGALGRALQTGRWRWWLGFGFIQFYLVWTHLGVVHMLMALNLAAVWLLFRLPRAERLVQSSRWAVASIASVMLGLGLLAPILPRFLGFMKKNVLEGTIDRTWLADMAGYLYCGTPWVDWDASNPLCFSLSQEAVPAWVAAAFMLLACALLVWGSWQLWRVPARRPLVIFLVGGPALMLAQLFIGNTRPYHWYLIPFLPNLFLLLAAAWPSAASKPSVTTRLIPILLLLTFTGIHLLGFECSRALTRHPIEPCRESVALTRTVTHPAHPDYGKEAITASPGMTTEAYDPAVIRFDSADQLRDLMAQAKREKRPLFLNFGFRRLLSSAQPEIFAMIDDPNLFEPVAVLQGQFVASTREVFRLRTEPGETISQ